MNIEDIYDKLQSKDNELKCITIKAGESTIAQYIGDKTGEKGEIPVLGINIQNREEDIIVQIIPVLYRIDPVYTDNTRLNTLVKNRATAVQELFRRWTKAGHNKRNAKSPFASKTFIRYLDDVLKYNEADYVVFAL